MDVSTLLDPLALPLAPKYLRNFLPLPLTWLCQPEVPSIIMDPITRINRDPKFHIVTRRYDDFVRTFCTNPGGFVVKEEYPDFIATNGHSITNQRSENTNFAFVR